MIVYHGTSKIAAKSIRQSGFKVGTWFAFTPEIARRYGPVILEADIDPLLLGDDVTDQFHTLVPLNSIPEETDGNIQAAAREVRMVAKLERAAARTVARERRLFERIS